MSSMHQFTNHIEDSLNGLCSLEPWQRAVATDELAAIGKPALEPLLRIMKHPNACLPAERVNYMHHSQVVHLVQAIQQSVDEVLGRIGQPAVEPLLELIQAKETPDPLRERVGQVLQRIGGSAVQPLTALLNHDNLEVRAVAASALADAKDEQAINALRETLYEAVKSTRRNRQRNRKFIALMATVYCLLVGISFMLSWHHFPFIILQIPVQTTVLLVSFDVQRKLRRNTITALGKSANPQLLGAFVACLEDSDTSVRKSAEEALIALLPRIQASDREFLSSAEMDILLKRLGGKNQQLTVAILKGLEQIGDEKALPKVEALASDGFNPEDIVMAAQACLPFLRERGNAVRQASTLLRASESRTAPETLLRPVQGSTPVEANQLLRPKL